MEELHFYVKVRTNHLNEELVGAVRFELTTFCSQSRRATNCAMPRTGLIKITLFSEKKSPEETFSSEKCKRKIWLLDYFEKY